MGKGYRQGRIGEEIKKIISTMLLREIKDPKLHEHMVSISAVDVSGDNSYATVYISVLGTGAGGFATDEQKDEVLAAFGRAKGLIKREIGKDIKLHHVPELIFKIDNSMEYGVHMEKLISGLDIRHDEDEAESTGSQELSEIMKDL